MDRLNNHQNSRVFMRLMLTLLIMFAIIACENKNTPSEQLKDNNFSSGLPQSFARLVNFELTDSNFEVKAIVDGTPYVVQNLVIDNTSKTFSGKIEEVPKGEHEIKLFYFVDGISVAESEFFSVNVEGGVANNANVETTKIKLADDDGDGTLSSEEVVTTEYIVNVGEDEPVLASNEFETFREIDEDGVITITTVTLTDTDGDGTPDYLDTDNS